MALKLEVVVTWDHECTKWHWIVHFKVVSFMLCEFLPQLKKTYSQMLEIRMWNSFIQGWPPSLNEWWKQSFLRKSAPEYSLEGLMLKLKLQYFGHLMPRTDSLEKTPIRLKAGGEGNDRWWDGCMASLIRWTWVWASSRSWWWTGKPGVLQSMRSQRVGHHWVTEQWQEGWQGIVILPTTPF